MTVGRVFVDTGAWFAVQVQDDAHHTEQVERQAYEILERFADHPFSFVDATSFALMRQQRTRHAFAFDIHFATAGFLRVPADVRLTE